LGFGTLNLSKTRARDAGVLLGGNPSGMMITR
jgi:hypothetical protein